MTVDTAKEQLRKAYPVGNARKAMDKGDTVSTEVEVPSDSDPVFETKGIKLARKEKTPMSTLTIRYPLEMEHRLEIISRNAGLNKTEVVMAIFDQTFPDLERQYNIKHR